MRQRSTHNSLQISTKWSCRGRRQNNPELATNQSVTTKEWASHLNSVDPEKVQTLCQNSAETANSPSNQVFSRTTWRAECIASKTNITSMFRAVYRCQRSVSNGSRIWASSSSYLERIFYHELLPKRMLRSIKVLKRHSRKSFSSQRKNVTSTSTKSNASSANYAFESKLTST